MDYMPPARAASQNRPAKDGRRAGAFPTRKQAMTQTNTLLSGPESSRLAGAVAEATFAPDHWGLCKRELMANPGDTAGEIGNPCGLTNAQAGRRLSERRGRETRNCAACAKHLESCVDPCERKEMKHCSVNGRLMQRWYHESYVPEKQRTLFEVQR